MDPTVADDSARRRSPAGTRRAATLTDVAKLAGVSVATASKALNGKTHVAAATRAKVFEAAEQLSFVPNPLAQGLLVGRTGTVGLLTGDLQGRFVLPILMAAEDAFGNGAVNVFLCDARGDTIRERHQLKALLSRRVDGLIVVGSRTDERESLGQQLPVPVVYVYAPSADPADTSFVPDNVAGGRLATEHLVSCGRRRIAHISGDVGYAAARDRALGVDEAMADAGLELVGAPMYSEWSEGWGRSASSLLLTQDPDIDAFVCGSDQIARGVLDTLRDLGRSVPDDVAVIGFDNWEPMVEHSRPRLTSVDPNLAALGTSAARQIFAALDGQDIEPGVHSQEPRLMIRGSTVAQR